jgi:hypothetical protein
MLGIGIAGTGDKIAGATGADVKLRAERKLGGRAEALTPHRLRSVFISFGARCGPWNTPLKTRFGLVKDTGGKIAGATGRGVKLRAERGLGGRPWGLPRDEIRAPRTVFPGCSWTDRSIRTGPKRWPHDGCAASSFALAARRPSAERIVGQAPG